MSIRTQKCNTNTLKENGSWEEKARPCVENKQQNRKNLIEHNIQSCL